MSGADPAPPWPELPQAEAGALAPGELRLLWCPAREDEAPRRQRIDALLRRVLAPMLAMAPTELRFAREAKGRPFLAHDGAPDFNLSDTTGGTLLALSHSARVGVDLELSARKPPAARLAARYFDAAEAEAIAALPPEQAARDFIWLWTAKEASCKATGTGIFGFLPKWQFAPGEAQPRVLSLPADAGEPARWSFLRVAPSSKHTAVIALRDAAAQLQLRAFTLFD